MTTQDSQPLRFDIPTQEFEFEKFKAVVHFLCHKAKPTDHLGKTKLHKLLWFADCESYVREARSIAGEAYTKQQYGPFSKHLEKALHELRAEGAVTTHSQTFAGMDMFAFVSQREPDLSKLTTSDIECLNETFDYFAPWTARQLSEHSHTDAWEIAQLGEEIPVYASLVQSVGQVTPDDAAWAREAFNSPNIQ